MPAVRGTRLRAECPRRPCRRAGANHTNTARTRTTDSCGGKLLYVPRRQSHRSTGVFPYICRCNTRCPPCSSRIYRKSAEISASLTAKGCFRRFDFQLRCFNNGIQRKFAEFPLAPTLGRCFNFKFRWKNNVIYFTKRKYTPYFRRRSLGQSRANIYRHISQFPRTTQTAHRLRRCAPSGKRRSPTRRPCHRAGEPA